MKHLLRAAALVATVASPAAGTNQGRLHDLARPPGSGPDDQVLTSTR
jgi:hypothetical protein